MGFRGFVAALLGATAFLSSCSTVNPYYDAKLKHHTPNGFVNNYGAAGGKPFSELLKWQWEQFKNSVPKAPSQLFQGYAGIPTVKPALDQLKTNCTEPALKQAGRCKEISITWVGHATVLIQMGGLNILTDPHFSERTFAVQFIGQNVRCPCR
jgi:N-acyl-phosphatidylethanolamine-hydrolysing phospholipase D